jgi:ceramide glucosyltransferase
MKLMLPFLAASVAIGLLILHLSTLAITWWRQRRTQQSDQSVQIPALTLIRPLAGIEPFSAATLRSTFALSPAPKRVIFCVERADDPIIPVVRDLIADYPEANSELLIGADRISENPKLNNLAKGWRVTDTPWVAFIDSNVLLPTDALSRIFEARREDTGMICSPPIGMAVDGPAAALEAAFLNTFQARWQSSVAACGAGFAQGKVMVFDRALIDAAGGLGVLGREPAEDAASTKVVRAAGRSVHLIDRFFPQPLGARTWAAVWDRQVRWAKLRRASFPSLYTWEIATGFWPAALAATAAAVMFDLDVAPALLTLALLWYGAEWLAARALGWPDQPWYGLLRDTLFPAIWINGWSASRVVWHGHSISTDRPEAAAGPEKRVDVALTSRAEQELASDVQGR